MTLATDFPEWISCSLVEFQAGIHSHQWAEWACANSSVVGGVQSFHQCSASCRPSSFGRSVTACSTFLGSACLQGLNHHLFIRLSHGNLLFRDFRRRAGLVLWVLPPQAAALQAVELIRARSDASVPGLHQLRPVAAGWMGCGRGI